MYYESEYSKLRFKTIDSKMPWFLRRIAHHISYARGMYVIWAFCLLLLWLLGSFQ